MFGAARTGFVANIGFYFVESDRGGVRPLEVFGAPEEAIKG